MNGSEVFDFLDVFDVEPIAVAEEEEGLFGVFGDEFAVGGEVEDAVVEKVFEGVEGEGGVEFGFAFEESWGVGLVGFDDRVEFVCDVGEGREAGGGVGES